MNKLLVSSSALGVLVVAVALVAGRPGGVAAAPERA